MKGLCLVIVACSLQLSLAAMYMEILDEDPGKPGKCLKDGVYHDKGSEWYTEGVCEKMLCDAGSEKGKMVIQHLGCGMVSAEPPCTVIPADSSKPYPSCCSSVTCPPGTQDDHQVVI